MINANNIILYPVNTEKAVRMMEAENKLTLVVDRRANKNQVKTAVEKMFSVKVEDVNTLIRPDGRKLAYVKLNKETHAMDVISRVGLI